MGPPASGAPLRAAALAAAAAASLWCGAAANRSPTPAVLAIAEDPLDLPADRPLRIDVGIYLDDFFGIDTATTHFKTDFWLSLRWMDARNAFNESDAGKPRILSLGGQDDTEVWLPDVTTTNSEPGYEPTVSNMMIYPNGTCVWMRRMILEFNSNVNFARFPFDEHELEMKFESKAYYRDDVTLQPWFHMTGHKDEKNSAGSYIWSILRHAPPRTSCGDICEDDLCAATCAETASSEEPTLVMSQYVKSAFSGAPDSSMLGSTMFKKYRVVASLKVHRVLGNLVYLYFLPSALLVFMSLLSFLPDCADLGTRLSASMTGLLTFEVMAERVSSKIPEMEKITWITVWHVFHVLFLTSIVLENGLARYHVVNTYKLVACTMDRLSFLLFLIWYLVSLIFLVSSTDSEHPGHLLVFIFIFVAAGQLSIVFFAELSLRATDRIVMQRLVGKGPLGRSRRITWAIVDRTIGMRERGVHRHSHCRCLRRALGNMGLRWDALSMPEAALQRLAYERIARQASHKDDPMAAELSEEEFIRGVWKSFARCITISEGGTNDDLSQVEAAARHVLKGRSVVFDAGARDDGDKGPVSFKASELLKRTLIAAAFNTSSSAVAQGGEDDASQTPEEQAPQ